MTTTIRRTTGPASHLSRDEEQRLDDRARLFRELAERKTREASLRSLEAALRELDIQADAAADAHNTAASPIQVELASPDITAARRSKLLGELAVLNDVLEKKIASVKSVREPLEIQKRELLSLITAAAAIEGSIQRSAPLADQAAAWSGKRALRFASERLAAAQQNHRSAVHELRVAQDDPRRFDVIQFVRRELEWGCEVASASKMLDMAREENDAAQKRLMED